MVEHRNVQQQPCVDQLAGQGFQAGQVVAILDDDREQAAAEVAVKSPISSMFEWLMFSPAPAIQTSAGHQKTGVSDRIIGARSDTSQPIIGTISRQWVKVELCHQMPAMSAASA